ncbi:MAG: isoprenylcysteine carboxylmethyltransferase family protein [Alphaproteobacteria bacterium]
MAGNRTAAGRASFSERIEAIAWTRTYDVLVRVPFIAWFLFLEFATITHLASYIDARGAVPDALFFTNVLARVAVILFLATWVAFVMLRSAPKRKTPGLWPRFAAFLGSFVMMALPLFPAHELSLGTSILSTMLIFAGDGFAVYVVFWLGRSVSLMPEARKLVTRGPYAVIRHPLYAAEEAAVVGTFLQFASPWTTLILVVHALIQIQRMGYEEQVLHQSFPEYGDYASRTARLIPGLY